jgi:hypothetical protein
VLAAVLDTCVVYSGLRRDFLLSLAAVGVFRVVLTEDILFEINYVEARKLVLGGDDTETARGKADHLTDELRSAFDVEDDSRILLIKPVGLPDPNDEHLVAAAVAGGAEVIVTDNVSDLPAALLPDGVRTQDPRSFLHDMVTANPRVALCALEDMSLRRRRPPQSARQILDLLHARELAYVDTIALLGRALTQVETSHDGPR